MRKLGKAFTVLSVIAFFLLLMAGNVLTVLVCGAALLVFSLAAFVLNRI